MDEREYWRVIVDAWTQLEEALPTLSDKQRKEAQRQMRELADELPAKFRALL